MTKKNRRIFLCILCITAALWASGFLLLDLAVPFLEYHFHDPDKPFIGGHGGGWLLIGTPLCILILIVSFVILRIRSSRE